MSQNGHKLNGSSSPTPTVAAAVHRQADRWRVVVVDTRNGMSLVQATSVDANDQIPPLLEQYNVERLVRVAPARETVARCVAVPSGDVAEVGAAVALQAEAQLPESIASHRRAGGVIAEADGSPGRAALLVGWQGEGEPELAEGVEETWTTPAAALSVLRQGKGQSAVYADPEEGAMSVLVFGDSRTLARVLVEDAPSPSAFARAVGNVAAETCNIAGVSAPVTPLGQSGIVLSMDSGVIGAARAAVSGVPDQKTWFEQYGIALGAAMIVLSKDTLVRPLASIKSSAPIKQVSPPERIVNWLAVRKHAWGVFAAALVLILLGPLAVAATRLAILESKAVGLGDRNRERAESARRAALYKQLEVSRWPMSKLLADVSAAIPMGVTTESIRLATDQGLTLQGAAESQDLVNKMQANLSSTKLLGNVKLNRVEDTGSGVEFDLTADVVSPHVKAAGVEDYAGKPLAVRLYGEGASNTAMPKNVTSSRESAPAREPRAISRSNDRPERPERTGGDRASERMADRGGDRGNDRGNNSERNSRSSEAPSRPAAASPGEAPPPLTDDQIAKMDKGAAMKEWAARKKYLPNADAGTKPRLDEEIRKLQEHFQKAGAPK